jgi:hypothetical protein
MANAPFDYYESSTAILPVGFRPAFDFEAIVPIFRDVIGNPITHQGHIEFLATGFVRLKPAQSDEQEEAWDGTDNGKQCGFATGTATYEAN